MSEFAPLSIDHKTESAQGNREGNPRSERSSSTFVIQGEAAPSIRQEQNPQRTHLEPELGGIFRDAPDRSGLEPELGGVLRQKGVYVDEMTCIGCKHCAHVARNTFYIEPDYGRSRAIRQDGDSEDLIQEAIDTCPVDCIHWVDYTELKKLEDERQYQVIPIVGYPLDGAVVAAHQRRKKQKLSRKKARY